MDYIATQIREKLTKCDKFDIVNGYGIKENSMVRFQKPTAIVPYDSKYLRHVTYHYSDDSKIKHILYSEDHSEIGAIRILYPDFKNTAIMRKKGLKGLKGLQKHRASRF